jgi:hypothetical protein
VGDGLVRDGGIKEVLAKYVEVDVHAELEVLKEAREAAANRKG